MKKVILLILALSLFLVGCDSEDAVFGDESQIIPEDITIDLPDEMLGYFGFYKIYKQIHLEKKSIEGKRIPFYANESDNVGIKLFDYTGIPYSYKLKDDGFCEILYKVNGELEDVHIYGDDRRYKVEGILKLEVRSKICYSGTVFECHGLDVHQITFIFTKINVNTATAKEHLNKEFYYNKRPYNSNLTIHNFCEQIVLLDRNKYSYDEIKDLIKTNFQVDTKNDVYKIVSELAYEHYKLLIKNNFDAKFYFILLDFDDNPLEKDIDSIIKDFKESLTSE